MRILIYGDSNSWGLLDDGQGLRYAKRWPEIMRTQLEARLGKAVELAEDCLPGRTTAYPDPQEGPEYNGLPYLKPALLSHAPLDFVLIMLGTNDMKARFDASAEAITDNLMSLAKITRRTPVGNGRWRDAPPPQVMLISPAIMGNRINNPSWLRFDEWLGGYDKMAALPPLLAQKIADLGDKSVHFADANEAVTPSERDPIHWGAESHHKMGEMMADKMAPLLRDS